MQTKPTVRLLKDADPDTRRAFQIELWVRGQSRHNDIENECVPDFTCCRAKPGSSMGVPRVSVTARLMFQSDPASRRSIIQDVIAEIGEEPDGAYFLAETAGIDVEVYQLRRGGE